MCSSDLAKTGACSDQAQTVPVAQVHWQVPAGATVRLRNMANGNEDQALAGSDGRFRLAVASDAGDALRLQVVGNNGQAAQEVYLKAPREGLARQRSTPGFRRFVQLAANILEGADAITVADRMFLNPLPGRGDGSYGGAAAKAVTQFGTLHYGVDYDGQTFTDNSGSREKEWGRDGVPDRFEPFAAKHKVSSVALTKTFEDAARAIQNGYPVAVCSMRGFSMTLRDGGYLTPMGQWAHCMMLAGVRWKPLAAHRLGP